MPTPRWRCAPVVTTMATWCIRLHAHTKFLDGAVGGPISGYRELTFGFAWSLALWHRYAEISGVSSTDKIVELNLHAAMINDLAMLSKLPSLTSIVVSFNNFTE